MTFWSIEAILFAHTHTKGNGALCMGAASQQHTACASSTNTTHANIAFQYEKKGLCRTRIPYSKSLIQNPNQILSYGSYRVAGPTWASLGGPS